MAAQREHWRANGPPTHIAVAIISASLGKKLTGDRQRRPAIDLGDVGIAGPSIVERAAKGQISFRPIAEDDAMAMMGV